MAFTCPCCQRISYNVTDEAEGYCGACHAWAGQPPPTLAERAEIEAIMREGLDEMSGQRITPDVIAQAKLRIAVRLALLPQLMEHDDA